LISVADLNPSDCRNRLKRWGGKANATFFLALRGGAGLRPDVSRLRAASRRPRGAGHRQRQLPGRQHAAHEHEQGRAHRRGGASPPRLRCRPEGERHQAGDAGGDRRLHGQDRQRHRRAVLLQRLRHPGRAPDLSHPPQRPDLDRGRRAPRRHRHRRGAGRDAPPRGEDQDRHSRCRPQESVRAPLSAGRRRPGPARRAREHARHVFGRARPGDE
jgi:hypothetical protein